MAIAARTKLRASIAGRAPLFVITGSGVVVNEATLRTEVITELEPYVRVLSLTTQTAAWDIGSWDYRSTLLIETLHSHARLDDLTAIVRHAFYEATDSYPDVTWPEYGDPEQPPVGPSKGPELTLAIAFIVAIGVAAFVVTNKWT